MSASDLLTLLSEWYGRQCDGHWEHQAGVVIETLDNPGWSVKIDLIGTTAESKDFEPIKVDEGDSNWMRCAKEGNFFTAFGDPSKLSSILEVFFRFVEVN